MHQCFVLWASRNFSFYFSRYIFNLICILFQNYQIMKSQIMMILITNILQISDGNTMKGICTVHRHSSIYTVNVGTQKSRTGFRPENPHNKISTEDCSAWSSASNLAAISSAMTSWLASKAIDSATSCSIAISIRASMSKSWARPPRISSSAVPLPLY